MVAYAISKFINCDFSSFKADFPDINIGLIYSTHKYLKAIYRAVQKNSSASQSICKNQQM